MCRLRYIAMRDYQKRVTTGQTHRQTHRRRTKWSLCAAMLGRWHNKWIIKVFEIPISSEDLFLFENFLLFLFFSTIFHFSFSPLFFIVEASKFQEISTTNTTSKRVKKKVILNKNLNFPWKFQGFHLIPSRTFIFHVTSFILFSTDSLQDYLSEVWSKIFSFVWYYPFITFFFCLWSEISLCHRVI